MRWPLPATVSGVLLAVLVACSAAAETRGGGEPNDIIDPNAPAVITDGGCFTTVRTIGQPLDVDFYRVAVTTLPAEGLQLAAYADGEAGTSGNPLVRVFDGAGNELAVNDSDGRPFDEDAYPDTDPRGQAHCPPRPGINALVSVHLSAAGNYHVAVSGGGCDAWDDVNCVPDPTGTCNAAYNPFVPNSGTPGQTGLYNLTVGLGSLAPVAREPSDSLGQAILPTNIGTPGAYQAFELGFLGNGPFGNCLGDFDYWRIPGSELTPGNALDIEVISEVPHTGFSNFMFVYERAAPGPHTLVAANDNTLGAPDARCLVEIRPGADYFVVLMPVGISPITIDTCFRQFAGFLDYGPGLDNAVPGGGDAIPGALGATFWGGYDLFINEIPLPPETGPFEPNDSLDQASANARIAVPVNATTAVQAYLGDGRYGWSINVGGVLGDTDLFELTGLTPGGAVECTATPHATNTTGLFIAFFEGNRMHDFTDIRLIFVPTGGLSASLLATVPPTGPYYVLVSPDDDRSLSYIGNYLPWDVTIPGTLLSGQYSGPYTLSVRTRTAPPAARAPSRMWGAARGAGTNQDILELDPDTGVEVNRLPAPATVNGSSTGLAINPDATVLYYANGPGIGGTQTLLWELNPENGNVTAATDLCQDWLIGQTLCNSIDGLGWAGEHVWMSAQNVARVYRWNPNTRQATGFFTAQSMGLTSFRDGLDGTDLSRLGSGHLIYVADRSGRRIAVIDVGPAGRGPAGDDVFVLLGTIPDPTWDGGPGISNNGGMAILRTNSGSPFQNLYCANINATLLHVVDANPAASGTIVGGWIYPDWGCSGLTAWDAPLAGDVDGDGDVDLSDFVLFQLCFAGSNNPPAPTCPPGIDADLDGDGDVDLADFLIFQQNFTGSL